MSQDKINQAYIKAWSDKVNAQKEDVILMISADQYGNISLHTINGLSQDKIRELLYQLAKGLDPGTIIKL